MLHEWPLLVSLATTLVFLAFGAAWLDDLTNPLWFALMLFWPFVAILL